MSIHIKGRRALRRRLTRISAVSLGIEGASFVATAAAEQQVASQQLEQAAVRATRTPVKVSDVVAEVTVFDRATLDRSEGRSLVELLSQAPGLQLSANGGLGKSSSLFVRGLEARHFLLLIDGVRVGSATLNTASLDNLPLDIIERIEIVRGPMTLLYGSNAMGGVVQVFTRRGQMGLLGNVHLSAGSRDYGLASGGVSFGTEDFDLAAQVQHQQTRGFSATNASAQFGKFNPDNDGVRQNAGSVRADWTFAPGWRVEGSRPSVPSRPSRPSSPRKTAWRCRWARRWRCSNASSRT